MTSETVNNYFKSLLAERYSISESTRINYARGEDVFEPVLPLGVAFPNTTEEVS